MVVVEGEIPGSFAVEVDRSGTGVEIALRQHLRIVAESSLVAVETD